MQCCLRLAELKRSYGVLFHIPPHAMPFTCLPRPLPDKGMPCAQPQFFTEIRTRQNAHMYHLPPYLPISLTAGAAPVLSAPAVGTYDTHKSTHACHALSVCNTLPAVLPSSSFLSSICRRHALPDVLLPPSSPLHPTSRCCSSAACVWLSLRRCGRVSNTSQHTHMPCLERLPSASLVPISRCCCSAACDWLSLRSWLRRALGTCWCSVAWTRGMAREQPGKCDFGGGGGSAALRRGWRRERQMKVVVQRQRGEYCVVRGGGQIRAMIQQQGGESYSDRGKGEGVLL